MGAINTGRKLFSYPNNGLYQGNKKMAKNFNYENAHSIGGYCDKKLLEEFVNRNGFHNCRWCRNGEMNYVDTLITGFVNYIGRDWKNYSYHEEYKDHWVIPYFDHADLFYRGGTKESPISEKVLVIQPYVDDEQAKEIFDWAKRHHFICEEMDVGYYYPNHARMFVIATCGNFPWILKNGKWVTV